MEPLFGGATWSALLPLFWQPTFLRANWPSNSSWKGFRIAACSLKFRVSPFRLFGVAFNCCSMSAKDESLCPGSSRLRRQSQRILPEDRINLLYFVGCPSRGCGSGPRNEWSSWRPPKRGTPNSCTHRSRHRRTDFDHRTWPDERMAKLCAAGQTLGQPVAALVPYAADRWPPRLATAMQLLHWSERTTARQVKHARRR